jgi:serine/threonine protein kinase
MINNNLTVADTTELLKASNLLDPRIFPCSMDPSHAKKVATSAERCIEKVVHNQDQDRRRTAIASLAPLIATEVVVGKLLGVGGSSCVYEVREFDFSTTSLSTATGMNPLQRNARDFLCQHALSIGSDSTMVSRFVIKHLKPELLLSSATFLKGAEDLSSEAQILLCLDHPNIAKLRGWSAGGSDAYRSGEHNAFFLVTDRLVETLLDRTCRSWRRQWKSLHRNGSRRQANAADRTSLKGPFMRWRWNERASTDGSSTGTRKGTGESRTLEESLQALVIERLTVAYHLACAVEYLHDQRIVHRDLKPTNIGFDLDDEVKVFDFGLSRFLPAQVTDRPEESFAMTLAGTDGYIAPEVHHQLYNSKSDVYSLGVVFWEMMSLSDHPKSFNGPMIVTCPCWPQPIRTLLMMMVEPLPDQRADMKSVRLALHDMIR